MKVTYRGAGDMQAAAIRVGDHLHWDGMEGVVLDIEYSGDGFLIVTTTDRRAWRILPHEMVVRL